MRVLMLVCLLGLTLASGCVSMAPAGPQTFVIANGVTYDELATQLRSGRPEAELMAAIRSRGMHHAPQAAELDALQAAGASQDLIDAVIIATWQPGNTAGSRYAYSGYPGYYGFPGYYAGPAVGVGLGYWGYRRHGPSGPAFVRPHTGTLSPLPSSPAFGSRGHVFPRPPRAPGARR